MSISTILFISVSALAAITSAMLAFTYYEFQQMRKHPERFPRSYKHLHPGD